MADIGDSCRSLGSRLFFRDSGFAQAVDEVLRSADQEYRLTRRREIGRRAKLTQLTATFESNEVDAGLAHEGLR
jgi:hypothetical protein